MMCRNKQFRFVKREEPKIKIREQQFKKDIASLRYRYGESKRNDQGLKDAIYLKIPGFQLTYCRTIPAVFYNPGVGKSGCILENQTYHTI